MKNNRLIKIIEELQKRIIDFDRYRFKIDVHKDIITAQPIGPELEGYEVDVDAGSKNFDRVMDELVPKVVNLIKIYKEKSNEK